MTVAEAVDRLPRRVAGWAAAQSLPPNSMTGISLALGLCAAVWFTAGTRPGNAAGALALCGRGRVRQAKATTATETAGSARANAGSASRLAQAGSAERIVVTEPAARARPNPVTDSQPGQAGGM